MVDKTLLELYLEHKGKVSDKWQSYLAVYERAVAQFRQRPARLLELGVQNGGSLEIWAAYLPTATDLVGCDIDTRCASLAFQDPRIRVVVGDANTDEVSARIAARAPFDVVIDDASHWPGDIVGLFCRYFPMLSPDGVYIAEDLHCSYWSQFDGGLLQPASSMSFFQRLTDLLNYEHWEKSATHSDVLGSFQSAYGVFLPAELTAQIHSIEFVNSMCVIRKRPSQFNVLGRRVIAGTDAAVDPEPLQLVSGLRRR